MSSKVVLAIALLGLFAALVVAAPVRGSASASLLESWSDSDADVDVEVEHEVAVAVDTEDASPCGKRGGFCMPTAGCASTPLKGLCPGGADVRCCLNPKRTEEKKEEKKDTPAPPKPDNSAGEFKGTPCGNKANGQGVCMDVSKCPSFGGSSVPKLCPGVKTNQCCIRSAKDKNTNQEDDDEEKAKPASQKIALIVDGDSQRLRVVQAENKGFVIKEYYVSTGKHGFGFVSDSGATPYGNFRIAAKQCSAAKMGEILVNRRPIGVIGRDPDRSAFMTTRILALEGLDKANRNTAARGILIHGTNRETQLGAMASHGCVRMFNKDVVELWNTVPVGTSLYIHPQAFKQYPATNTFAPAAKNTCGTACK